MTWLQYGAYLAIGSGARWLLARVTPHAGEYLFGGLVLGCLAWLVYERSRGRAMLDLCLRSSDAEREALAPALLDAVGLRSALAVPVDPGDRLAFHYPPASRGLLTFQFWGSVLFAAGTVRPLLSSGAVDPGNGWVLFVLAGFFILTAFAARRQLRWAGQSVIVDRGGLEVHRGSRLRQRI